jgi:N-acetylneuraminate synthase
MDPNTWLEMVLRTRQLEAALGSGDKVVEANEKETVIIQRRCVRASHDLKAGDLIERKDLTVLRPATPGAILPYEIEAVQGKHARTDIPSGKDLHWTDLSE